MGNVEPGKKAGKDQRDELAGLNPAPPGRVIRSIPFHAINWTWVRRIWTVTSVLTLLSQLALAQVGPCVDFLAADPVAESQLLAPQGGWGPAALAWARAFNQRAPLFANGQAISVWVNIQLTFKNFMASMFRTSPRSLQLSIPGLQGRARILISEPDPEFCTESKAQPLVILVPTVFSDGANHANMYTVRALNSRGYRVAVVPNPSSPEYVRMRPRHPLGSVPDEARTLLQMVAEIKREIGASAISRTELMGRSYGGFVASVMMALDAQSTTPLFDGQVTMIGPSIDRQKAMDRFDRSLQQHAQTYWDCCRGRNIAMIYDYLKADAQHHLSNATQAAVDAFFSYVGFQTGLIDLAVAVDQTRNLGLVPSDPSTMEKWKFALRFSEVSEKFIPPEGNNPEHPEFNDMSYWLMLASQANPQLSVRIVSAIDDFLSDRHDWNLTQYYQYGPGNLMLLSWGGHMGYEALPEYQQLLDIMFPPQPRAAMTLPPPPPF